MNLDWTVWARIGVLGFGGPAAQIALMHAEIVEKRRWIDEARFLQALNVCMLLPGPEAMQLATWIGWMRGGWRGGLVAGGLFVLPGALAVMALSWIYVLAGDLGWIAGLFFGLKAAVIALVAQAVLKVSRKALRGGLHLALALAAFVALYALGAPFPLVMLAAAVIGYLLIQRPPAPMPAPAPAGRWVIVIWLALWLVPVAGIALAMGPDNVLTQVALFFSQMAVLTFGGAYAVLAWVAQAAVDNFGWLSAAQMLDGLALAETTPGPLILVLQFVGFLAGWNASGGSLGVATLAGVVATWVTFAPCFLWVFAIAPRAEALSRMPRLVGALEGVTAAVVGVIANLALWFALHALFGTLLPWGRMEVPVWSTLDPVALGLTVLALGCVFGLKMRVGTLIVLFGALGAVLSLAG